MTTATTTNGAPHATSSSAKKSIRLRIKRCDGPGKPEQWQSFDVPLEPGLNIIACLQKIAANPVTVNGERTTPVVWDSGCLEEVCGACTMVVNGKVRQSCSFVIDESMAGQEITIEPMTKYPVVRDLSVDRSRLFRALERVKAWVPIDGTHHLGSGPLESPDDQATRYVLSTCMSCGCCLEACPQYQREDDPAKWDQSFVGAHALSQARLFNLHKTGAALKDQRLDALSDAGGVNDCGNAQNCVKVCPKEIPLTESIAAMGRAVTVHNIKKFFMGR
ncbi:MAG: succinate dehydrogenase iron-sulfur subunit [Phycisphaerales bacterium]|nr:MAG: succinate dehydrogenase iron-sulfur subunit [Phycisphaerales bacterium]